MAVNLKKESIKTFNSLEELQNDKELQCMGRYCWQKVKLEGKEVFACSTNQQYEDILWGGIHEIMTQLFDHFEIEDEDKGEYSSLARDYILELLEENGIKFVDVYDEY